MSDNDINAANNPYAAPHSAMLDVAADARLATRLERFLAALVDAFLLGAITMIPAMIMFGGWMGYMGVAASHPWLFRLGSALIGIVLFLLINGTFLARDGQTIGKKAMSIKIVGADGGKADFARIILRRQAPIWACQLVPFVGGVLILIDTLCIFRDTRRCIHDDIADTKVVKA